MARNEKHDEECLVWVFLQAILDLDGDPVDCLFITVVIDDVEFVSIFVVDTEFGQNRLELHNVLPALGVSFFILQVVHGLGYFAFLVQPDGAVIGLGVYESNGEVGVEIHERLLLLHG